MKMTQEERTLVQDNMGLVGAVIRDHVQDVHKLGIFTPEDIYQIGCLGLCKAAMKNRIESDAKFSTYAYICIRNEIFSALEYATVRRRREVLIDVFDDTQEAAVYADSFTEASDLEELARELDNLKRAASGITAKGIEAMQLYAKGYNYREIGEMMGGVPAKNVTAWVSRARKFLKGMPEIAELHSDTF